MLEVFRVPPDLQENLIAFCGRQNCYNLQELDRVRDDLSAYCGAYLLYYQGDFSMYNVIQQANLNKCCMPIYSRFHVYEVLPDYSSIAVGTRHCRVPTSVVYLTNLKSAVCR